VPPLERFGAWSAAQYLRLMGVLHREGLDETLRAFVDQHKRRLDEEQRKAEEAARQLGFGAPG
jgi:hypothetical protein